MPLLSASSPLKLHDIDAGGGRTPIHTGIDLDAVVTAKILPQFYHHCDPEDIVIMASGVLEDAITENDEKSLPTRSKGLTPFHSMFRSSISVRDYLLRITKGLTLSPAILLCMV
ncbi:Uncharacterized protein TPAR_08729 [Tolypocladium paradoxum]|uniref:Uncharacterized protein n=1 Tax=Tolypocladium paradoxum TaxID=94208 RepID=A0A2S4KLK2_9HYPO|nr:Uncharacterized protein TPAR_08729 [Tolypocladium paradoxum]